MTRRRKIDVTPELKFKITLGESEVITLEQMLSFAQELRPSPDGAEMLSTFKELLLKIEDHRGVLDELVPGAPTQIAAHPLGDDELSDDSDELLEDGDDGPIDIPPPPTTPSED